MRESERPDFAANLALHQSEQVFEPWGRYAKRGGEAPTVLLVNGFFMLLSHA